MNKITPDLFDLECSQTTYFRKLILDGFEDTLWDKFHRNLQFVLGMSWAEGEPFGLVWRGRWREEG